MKTLLLTAALVGAAASAGAVLSPAEKQVYQGLAPDAQKSYSDTREYLHTAQYIVKNPKSALTFPDQPKDFDPTYVSKDEQATIDKALDLNIAAMINGIHIG